MAFTDMEDIEPGMEEAGPPPEESGNRTFLLVAGILGGILLLSLLCIAAYVVFLYPQRQAQQATQQAEAIAQSTAMSLSVTQTSQAARWTSTKAPTRVVNTSTPAPTNTPVVAGPVTQTGVATTDPRTATVAALFTEAAIKQKTPLLTTTALPTSGFADEVGVPGMILVAFVLIVVIFLARRLRTAS